MSLYLHALSCSIILHVLSCSIIYMHYHVVLFTCSIITIHCWVESCPIATWHKFQKCRIALRSEVIGPMTGLFDRAVGTTAKVHA